jgi:antitoxin VapB
MPLNIRSEEVNKLAEELAAKRHVTKTEAVKLALVNELERDKQDVSLSERLKPIQDRIMARGRTGLKADKAFFDELSGQGDE